MAYTATASDKQNFIQRMWEAIKSQSNLYGLYPSVIIAQGALESAWGLSELSSQYNNYFGVKSSATQYSDAWIPGRSPSVNTRTSEYIGGAWQNDYTDLFRVYSSIADSVTDRNALVAANPRYKAALSAKSPEEQIQALKAGGYATDPDYISKVTRTLNSNNLKQYDELYNQYLASRPKPRPRILFRQSQNKETKHPFLKLVVWILVLAALGYLGYKFLPTIIQKLKK